ncbi:MAG: hypothetical protein QOG00_2135 [Pyrinomonadaceae bacterium]|nr:hypothetical protein [Pyrinomonadaceae bacterium]
MPQPNPTLTTYVFIDVVDFSLRTSGEQADIFREMNALVRGALEQRHDIPDDKLILLPAGDGVCICLQADARMAYDVHMQLALHLLKQLHERAASPETATPEFALRIGINSNNDMEVIDINGQRNMAGAGINMTQRIMGLADGNQIIVSDTIYSLLKNHTDYPPASFREFTSIVKHDEEITVYQYIDERHAAEGLNIEPPNALRHPDIRKPGRQTGLVNIYPLRNEQVFHDLRADIRNAQKRIWLAGVGLSEVVPLTELLETLSAKSQVQIDDERKLQIRLLMLDAISSPAAFRTFLESSNRQFKEYLDADRHAPQNPLEEHPYFNHQLFNHFKETYDKLVSMTERSDSALKDAVRFYAHNPSCWLAIVDDTAYFQPYTFGGKTSNEHGSFTIGHLMPVFKYRAGAQRDVFELLEDHFHKLWITTDTDLFHVGVRLANRAYFTKMMFNIRRHWFRHVYGALHPIRRSQEGKKRKRLKPRKPCHLKRQRREILVTWTVSNHLLWVKCPIINYSREGVLLEVTDQPYHPEPNEIVELKIVSAAGSDETEREPPEAAYLKIKLISPTDGKFIVLRREQRVEKKKRSAQDEPGKRDEGGKLRTFIALQAYDEAGASLTPKG